MVSPSLHVSPTQFSNAIEMLERFVAIPSVSNPESPDYSMVQLEKAAEFARSELETLGFKAGLTRIEGSAPYVIAERVTDITKPILLLYAHYDVQPVDREKWESDPFVMQEKQGRLYGRGASDDKAGIVAILTALRVYQEAGKELPVNIKVLFEGEEEYGSSHMSALLKEKAKQLHAHALIVLDSANRDVETGTLTSSTRGLVNLKLRVKALEKPLHSGIGCLVPDPAQALAALIHSLNDPQAIPGFMDDYEPLTAEDREVLRHGSISPETYAQENGVISGAILRGDPTHSIDERIMETPSISVVNMNCGKPNGGNSIQDSASCEIGIRVTAGQDPNRVGKVVMDYLRSQPVMYGLPIEIEQTMAGMWAWKASLSGPFTTQYFESLRGQFSKTCGMPLGGSLPLLREFKQIFPDMEMILPGVEDPATSAHSHNESQDKKVLERTINSLADFMDRAGKIQLK